MIELGKGAVLGQIGTGIAGIADALAVGHLDRDRAIEIIVLRDSPASGIARAWGQAVWRDRLRLINGPISRIRRIDRIRGVGQPGQRTER
ncbi:MAG: hypothetical protein ACLQIB_13255 [Isosphaeraceae bacterium]